MSTQAMKALDTKISEDSQRELAASLLRQAVGDLQRFNGTTNAVEREFYLDAYSWILADDHDWPFSFLNVCRLLNWRPNDLREELLGDPSVGVFTRCARRGNRALRRFSDSLFQRSGPNLIPSNFALRLQTQSASH